MAGQKTRYVRRVHDVAAWILVIAAVGFAVLSVAVEEAARAGACLIGASLFAAGLAFLEGAGDLSVAVLTTVAAGAAVLVLLTALLLNLAREERGGRRFRIQPTVHLLVIGFVAVATWRAGGAVEHSPQLPLAAGSAAKPLFEDLGFALALCGVTLLATLIGGLVVVRKRG